MSARTDSAVSATTPWSVSPNPPSRRCCPGLPSSPARRRIRGGSPRAAPPRGAAPHVPRAGFVVPRQGDRDGRRRARALRALRAERPRRAPAGASVAVGALTRQRRLPASDHTDRHRADPGHRAFLRLSSAWSHLTYSWIFARYCAGMLLEVAAHDRVAHLRGQGRHPRRHVRPARGAGRLRVVRLAVAAAVGVAGILRLLAAVLGLALLPSGPRPAPCAGRGPRASAAVRCPAARPSRLRTSFTAAPCGPAPRARPGCCRPSGAGP